MDKCVVVITECEQGELTLASLECGRRPQIADRFDANQAIFVR